MRYEVQSSSVKAIEETGRGTMIVEFHKGGKYEYFDVPLDLIQEFAASDSVGRFFNERIRGNFREEARS